MGFTNLAQTTLELNKAGLIASVAMLLPLLMSLILVPYFESQGYYYAVGIWLFPSMLGVGGVVCLCIVLFDYLRSFLTQHETKEAKV